MEESKRCLVTGSGGFIGSHLVKYLKAQGHWVRGVDLKKPLWSDSPADDFKIMDLREPQNAVEAVVGCKYVYDLAADMGGMGFISISNASNLYDNDMINANVLEASRKWGVERYFFSSSVCIYPKQKLKTPHPKPLEEIDAIPANPAEGYGWQKLMHEMRCLYYKQDYHLETRIARFDNTYGPEGTYEGNRAKAPAALCLKVIQAKENDRVEVWGDGKQTRYFTYIDDTVHGIYLLMNSDYDGPVNIGHNKEQISIGNLARKIIKISGKKLRIKYVDGPQGARGRCFNNNLAKSVLGFEAETKLDDGLLKTYEWIRQRVTQA